MQSAQVFPFRCLSLLNRELLITAFTKSHVLLTRIVLLLAEVIG
jgi:hypothetical protein